MESVISAGKRPNPFKNVVASFTGVPLAPFDSLRAISSYLLLPSSTKIFHRKNQPSQEPCKTFATRAASVLIAPLPLAPV
jgi:hypothetical protein